jgi:rubrerythrin
MAPPLKGSKTLDNLRYAFARESQANRRYTYFARQADLEGHPDIAALFREVAEGETGHAFGHFNLLKEEGDPATGLELGDTEKNLMSAVEGESREYSEEYPTFARIAREEGFVEIAAWFETLCRAEQSHATRLSKGLQSLRQ